MMRGLVAVCLLLGAATAVRLGTATRAAKVYHQQTQWLEGLPGTQLQEMTSLKAQAVSSCQRGHLELLQQAKRVI